VLRPIAEEIGAEMILVTGESSDTYIADAAKRASEDGRPAVVFYFADFDPSGHQMPISVARKLQAQRDLHYPNLDVRLYQVAMTLEQVRDLNLPSTPLKETEKRADKWRAAMGHEQTEIDAMVELHPAALRDAVYEAIAPFYDDGLKDRVHAVETVWRERADEVLQSHPSYKGASQRIKAAWGRVKSATTELHHEPQNLADILRENVPPPPDLPKAEPECEAPAPLFHSQVDFVTASRQLIRRKRLIGENG
jgi:hypothetical protein